ncbi:hypothetical protein [Lusitaniella coriacea]|uniref:hypothetical protein n=1 Tax=Lusitaniella coriacea TaxID=1983105 RepID=UPI003CECC377
MDEQLTLAEIERKQDLLQDYSPAQRALNVLQAEEGDIQASFEKLWAETNGTIPTMAEGQSIWEVTKEVLRDEICGDEGFKAKVKEYNNNPASAPLLTGLIVYVASLAGATLNPAIATILVLWLVKVGMEVFCRYTEPNNPN